MKRPFKRFKKKKTVKINHSKPSKSSTSGESDNLYYESHHSDTTHLINPANLHSFLNPLRQSKESESNNHSDSTSSYDSDHLDNDSSGFDSDSSDSSFD